MRPMLAILLLAACGDVENPEPPDNDQEVVTTVELTFTAVGGGEPIVATWADPENDGDPVVDPIALAAGEAYAVSVRFLNELASPAEDLTAEVEQESDEHQVFFTGSAVGEALTVAYADEDEGGLPVGLSVTLTTLGAGVGDLVVTLRHLPPQDGEPQKVEGLEAVVESDGLEAIPGETDASVTFDVTVE